MVEVVFMYVLNVLKYIYVYIQYFTTIYKIASNRGLVVFQ